MGRTIGRALVLILAAAACAAFSNATASRERKMAWVGAYPRALDISPVSESASVPATEPPPASPAPAASTAAPSPAPPASAAGSPAGSAAAAAAFPPHPDRAFVEIGTDDAQALFKQGRLFLDARRSSVYADGHVPGARSFPVWESDVADRVKAFYEEGLDQNAPIVIYCSGGDCEDSHMLAEKLYMVGFNDLLVDKDGFPAWQKRGLPVTKGAKP